MPIIIILHHNFDIIRLNFNWRAYQNHWNFKFAIKVCSRKLIYQWINFSFLTFCKFYVWKHKLDLHCSQIVNTSRMSNDSSHLNINSRTHTAATRHNVLDNTQKWYTVVSRNISQLTTGWFLDSRNDFLKLHISSTFIVYNNIISFHSVCVMPHLHFSSAGRWESFV